MSAQQQQQQQQLPILSIKSNQIKSNQIKIKSTLTTPVLFPPPPHQCDPMFQKGCISFHFISIHFHEAKCHPLGRTFSVSYCICHEVSSQCIRIFYIRPMFASYALELMYSVSHSGSRIHRSIGCVTVFPCCLRPLLTQEPAQRPVCGGFDPASISSKNMVVLYKGFADMMKA